MGSTTKGPYDPTVTQPIDTLLGNSVAGCILIHNLSQYELYVTTPDAAMTSFVAAWGWRRFDASDPLPIVSWSIAATPSQTNPPLSAVFVESYEDRTQAPPQYFGQYQRQTSVGGGTVTTSNTYTLFAQDNTEFFAVNLASAGFSYLRLRPQTTSGLGPLGSSLCFLNAGGGFADGVIVTQNGFIEIPNTIVSLGGEAAAAGALGVPVVDGLTSAQHITTTGLQTILSFTPASTGLYRVSCYVYINNGVVGNDATFKLQFTDPDTGSAKNIALFSAMAGQFMDGAHSFTNQPNAMVPLAFRAEAGQPIIVTYQDPTNSPSDYVSAFVERIA